MDLTTWQVDFNLAEIIFTAVQCEGNYFEDTLFEPAKTRGHCNHILYLITLGSSTKDITYRYWLSGLNENGIVELWIKLLEAREAINFAELRLKYRLIPDIPLDVTLERLDAEHKFCHAIREFALEEFPQRPKVLEARQRPRPANDPVCRELICQNAACTKQHNPKLWWPTHCTEHPSTCKCDRIHTPAN